MEKEYILWATPKDSEFEEVITETKSLDHLQKAKDWAIENGFKNLRVLEYGGEAPDFSGIFNKNKRR
jgi:hypothetical protein